MVVAPTEHSEAYLEGWIAAAEGLDASVNPRGAGSVEAGEWMDGWLAWHLAQGSESEIDPQIFRSGH